MKRYLLTKPAARMLIDRPLIIVVDSLRKLLAWSKLPVR
jgi:hypothetical protein